MLQNLNYEGKKKLYVWHTSSLFLVVCSRSSLASRSLTLASSLLTVALSTVDSVKKSSLDWSSDT